jgi:superfamily II DNA or RNA helicase
LPGTGIQNALEEAAIEASAKGLVLILAPFAVLIDQWATRLGRRGAEVQVLRSAADALEFRSLSQEHAPRGIVIATFARARHGQARTALLEHRFELVLYDGVAGTLPEFLGAHAFGGATREVAVVSGSSPFAWEGAKTVVDVTEEEFDEATSGIVLRTRQYEESVGETETLSKARGLVTRFLRPEPGDLSSATPASLHEMLLKVATGAIASFKPTPEEEAEAWGLVDELENVTTVDGKLSALDSVLRERGDVRRWVVSVLRRADASYVAEHLNAQGIAAKVLTADVPAYEREAVLTSEAPVIVATTAVLTSLGRWPRGYGAIWWTLPRTRNDYEGRMALLATAGHAQVVQLAPRGQD